VNADIVAGVLNEFLRIVPDQLALLLAQKLEVPVDRVDELPPGFVLDKYGRISVLGLLNTFLMPTGTLVNAHYDNQTAQLLRFGTIPVEQTQFAER
jgi:hypothetical protein